MMMSGDDEVDSICLVGDGVRERTMPGCWRGGKVRGKEGVELLISMTPTQKASACTSSRSDHHGRA